MKIVPVFKVRNMRAALKHYTEVLDFVMTAPVGTADALVIDLGNGDAEFQITVLENDRLFGSVANVWVNDVDALFAKYKSRGLDTSGKEAGAGRSNLGPPRILCERCRWQYLAVCTGDKSLNFLLLAR